MRRGGIHEEGWSGGPFVHCSLMVSLWKSPPERSVIKSELHKGLRAYRFTSSKGASIRMLGGGDQYKQFK